MKKGKKILRVLVMAMLFSLVFMTASVSAYSINKKATTITKGFSEKLSVPGAKKVKWNSSNKKVATVNKSGKVTAKNVGRTVITATIGTEKYTCNVFVRENAFRSIDSFRYSGFGVGLYISGLKYNGSGMSVSGYLYNAGPFFQNLNTVSLKIYDRSNGKNKTLVNGNVRINRCLYPRSYVPITLSIPKKCVKSKKYDLGSMSYLYNFMKY